MNRSFLQQTLSIVRFPHALAMRQGSLEDFLVAFNMLIKSNSEHPDGYNDVIKPTIDAYIGHNVGLTTDYDNTGITNSVALYYAYDMITYDSWWYFSTKQFVADLLSAENNDNILAHLIILNTPGGTTYYLNEVFKTIRSLKKPVYAVCERQCASAGVWIASAADKVYCLNKFDEVGSIGVMISFWDWSEMLAKYGIKEVTEYATISTHKNKDYRDLLEGNSEEFIKRFMDPLCEDFIDSVKSGRPKSKDAPEEAHVFNGAMFYAEQAKQYGLIDGIKPLEEIFSELVEQGLQQKLTAAIQSNAIYQL